MLKRKLEEDKEDYTSSEEEDNEDDDESMDDADEEDNSDDSGNSTDNEDVAELNANNLDVKDSDVEDDEDEDIVNDEHDLTLTEKEETTKQVSYPVQTTIKISRNATATSGEVAKPNEYDHDSSDEENIRSTVGNIPIEWYREYKHLGYDVEGKKIIKPNIDENEVDNYLRRTDDPHYWRTVKDKYTGQEVILTDADADLVQRIRKGHYPDPNYNPYQPFIDFFTYEKMIHPVTNRPETKASFIPSLSEKRAVSKLVARIKRKKQIKLPQHKAKDERFIFNYDAWEEDGPMTKRTMRHIPAPKMALPGHAESYNPPPEYLLTEEEEEKWKEQEPEERKANFIPQKFKHLRQVPAYNDFVKERFDRLLDLYLCPRAKKQRANVDPEALIPVLPKPKDLQPFPTMQSIIYSGHKAGVRCISIEPTGQYLASGSEDNTVKIWEVLTGRCLKTMTYEDRINCIAWNPVQNKCICLVATGKQVFILNPHVGDKLVVKSTDEIIKNCTADDNDKATVVTWTEIDVNEKPESFNQGDRLMIEHKFEVTQVTWHQKGDYFAAVMPSGSNQSVVIHQLSKRRSQIPFRKSKGLIQYVLFHPLRPYFFVATQRYIRIYNLMKQELTKKLFGNCKHISSMAIHPKGDNLIIGSYDLKLSWFDLDLSDKPYKTMRYHKKSIRKVAYHSKYPIFASSSDDGSVVISHGMVYDDLLQNALIVPVKVLHAMPLNTGVIFSDCCFHPTQPWVFSAGSDSLIRLFT